MLGNLVSDAVGTLSYVKCRLLLGRGCPVCSGGNGLGRSRRDYGMPGGDLGGREARLGPVRLGRSVWLVKRGRYR